MGNKPTYFPLTELIDELLKNGFIIGTDTYLHLHQLLDAIDIEENYPILPQYLCPLFANDAKQQQKFYEIYNRLVELPAPEPAKIDQVVQPPLPGIEIKPEKLKRTWLFYITAALVFVLIVVAGYLIYSVKTKPIVLEEKSNTQKLDSLKQIPQPIITITDTIATLQKKQTNLSKEKDKISYQLIRYALLISILLLFIVYQIYQYLTRRLIAKRKHERKPPFIWSIRIKDQCIGLDSAIYSIANSMRFRTLSGLAKVDLKKTIDHTCKNGGIPILQYTLNTKPVEYLMLIDWSNERNHQAQLFDYLYRTFVNNNVYIDRYYYDSDPRICWNEIHNDGITLDKLQHQYPEAYLLVFGNGAGFIDPFTNTLYQYAGVFKEW